MSDRVAFTCNDTAVVVDAAPGETLLSVLRERLGIVSVKDGCAPQGQCGCCTVLVDGEPRVSCVTPVARVVGRSVTTVEGLAAPPRDALVSALLATGGSQCGFCTPGIVMRVAALLDKGRTDRADLDKALDAHLCRCTGWQSIYEAIAAVAAGAPATGHDRDLDAASLRAALEGGTPQSVAPEVTTGHGGFADDLAPRDALVAVPTGRGTEPEGSTEMVGRGEPGPPFPTVVEAAGLRFVVAESAAEAFGGAGRTRGRRSTGEPAPPLPLPACPPGGVRLATGWVEPAFLEPDASWCAPGGEPATPLANGGAFGGKQASPAGAAARELADRLGRPVRVLFSRGDAVRLGPKRPPVAACAVFDGARVVIDGDVVGSAALPVPDSWPYRLAVEARWRPVAVPGPPVSRALRAAGLAEHAVLVEGALAEAGADRAALVRDERAAAVLLETCMGAPSGALAGAEVSVDEEAGTVKGVRVRVAAGDPLDEVVLRSYALGATHMALGWVLTERLAVDPASGEVLDQTIRSFGIVRPRDVPPVKVEVVPEAGPPLAGASDAVFAAVAAATWNAVARVEGSRPEVFPARETRAGRHLRR